MNRPARQLDPGPPVTIDVRHNPTASATGAAGQSAVVSTLLPETKRHLQTLTALCRRVAGASAAALFAQTASGWRLLAEEAGNATDLALLRQIMLTPFPDREPALAERMEGRQVVRLVTPFGLALLLAVGCRLDESVVTSLGEALALAEPLARAERMREQLRRARGDLLAVKSELAHELRTPLTAVSGFAQLLGRPGTLDEGRRRNYAAITLSESQSAIAVVDRIVIQFQAAADSVESAAEAANDFTAAS